MFEIKRRILPDVAALVADHGLVAELQAVVWVEHGEVGADQAPETVIQMDPGGVTGDGHVTYPDLGPLEVTGGDHGDRHQHLVQVSLEAAGDLEQRAALLIAACLANSQILLCLSTGRSLHNRVYRENILFPPFQFPNIQFSENVKSRAIEMSFQTSPNNICMRVARY